MERVSVGCATMRQSLYRTLLIFVSPTLAYTIAYRPCAPRLLTLCSGASSGPQGQ